MEAAKKEAHDIFGAIAGHGMTLLGRRTLERQLAIAFAKQISLPGEEKVAAVLHCLRNHGCLVCASAGRDLLRECPCFRSLAKERTGEDLKAALSERMDALEASAFGGRE